MEDDVQNTEGSHTCVELEKYLPYTCTELTSKHVEFAKRYLNETEETRNKALRSIKIFIKEELDVFSHMDDSFLLNFLRSNMFNIEQACVMMKNSANFLQNNRNYLSRIDTEIMRRVIESKVVNFLPYRDAKGRAICLVLAENWDPADLTAEDIIFGNVLALHAAAENPVNQVTGFVAIVDCKGVSFSQFSEFSSWFLFCANLQNCTPALVHEVHVLHTPSVVLLAWSIIQPLLYENIKKTLTFYDSSNWESLYEKIPPCILPEEIGGHLGPFSYEDLTGDIPTIREKFFDKFHRCFDE